MCLSLSLWLGGVVLVVAYAVFGGVLFCVLLLCGIDVVLEVALWGGVGRMMRRRRSVDGMLGLRMGMGSRVVGFAASF